MPQLPIRLIATDVDGTLLDRQGQMPEENLRAIRAAQEKGIVVAISSGRFAENVYILLQNYGLSCPIISINGARLVDENLRLLSAHFMDRQAAWRVRDALDEAGADYFIFGHRMICTSKLDRSHQSELSQKEKVNALGLFYDHGPEAITRCLQEPIYKFFVYDTIPLPPLREELKKLPEIELTQSSPRNIEIMPRGVNKGFGVVSLAARLQIPLAQVMTLGDQENDIPMLSAAGCGVAMGNASPETKAAARYVTDTNQECGFAKAVERFALRPSEAA